MSRFGSIHRVKPGNCTNPFRQFRDERFFQDDTRYSRTTASTSRDLSPHRRDAPKNNKYGMHYGFQDWDTGGIYQTRPRCNRGKSKVNFNRDRKMSAGPRDWPEENLEASGSSNRKPKPKCPPHLTGKKIGLWHMMNRLRSEEITEISLDPKSEKSIEEFLQSTEVYLSENNDELIDYGGSPDSGTFEENIASRICHHKVQDPDLDIALFNAYNKKKLKSQYNEMAVFRENLPSFKMKDEIIKLIDSNQVTVVSGATGCGKTTQIVQYILDDFIMKMKGSLCSIVCTQPRRISAVSVAERVAEERAEALTESIGYQIRLENKLAERRYGCINFLTTGILLQWLVGESTLENVSHLFLDEVHERTIECDLVLALLKYIIPKRPDLKVILMSATVNVNSFSDYFDGAPTIEIPGFTYPVEEIFLEDILQLTMHKFQTLKRPPPMEPYFMSYVLPYIRDIEARGLYPKYVTKELRNPLSEELDIDLIVATVRYICHNEGDGAILVFVPGLMDITVVNKEIRNSPWFLPSKYVVVLVHSLLPSIEQKEAFLPPPEGQRKIVIATSILETSVTINDISFVVDCGKKKVNGYDLKYKVATLKPSWIDMASAKQRRGRAGRTKPGKCYKLYTKIRQEGFDLFTTPEIQKTGLEQVILKAKELKIQSVAPFLEKMMDAPEREMVDHALKVLTNLNALDDQERLTPLGYHLSKLPMDPHAGKMILMGALFSCVDPVFSVAACLSFKDPFSIPLGREDELDKVKEQFACGEKSDHLIYSQILRQWEEEPPSQRKNFACHNFLSNHTMFLLSKMKMQFAELLCSMNFLTSSNVKDPASNVNSENTDLVKAVICAGLYPNIALLVQLKKTALLKTSDHKRIRFHMKSYCSRLTSFESPFFVYHYMLMSSAIFIHDASMISPMPLILFGKRLKIIEKGPMYILEVDDLIKFKVNRRIAVLLKRLRNRLDWTLGVAIFNSKGFDWQSLEEKAKILNGIVNLISSNCIKHRTITIEKEP